MFVRSFQFCKFMGVGFVSNIKYYYLFQHRAFLVFFQPFALIILHTGQWISKAINNMASFGFIFVKLFERIMKKR